MVAPAPPPKSSFGGLRRLGTVLGGGRSNKGAKAMDRAPSPEKRSRPMRNPLRRGTSSHQNMESIPSPPSSSSHLPQSPPQPEAPLTQPVPLQAAERPRSQERRVSNDQVNGDRIQPAPTRVSSLPGITNGTSSPANRDLATVQESQAASPPGPPPGKMADVSNCCYRGLVLTNSRRLSVIPKAIVFHHQLWMISLVLSKKQRQLGESRYPFPST